VFSALHDQLASLDRDAQLTRCFSALAELLVGVMTPVLRDVTKDAKDRRAMTWVREVEFCSLHV